MADKDDTERRVYVLPKELLTRLRAYQTDQSIPSEVEAVRRLLDSALQMRDTVETILEKLKARYAEEKDLRVLARDVLTGHALVKSIKLDDAHVEFALRDGTAGQIDRKGELFKGDDGDQYMRPYSPPSQPQARQHSAAPTPTKPTGSGLWEPAKTGGDLDDEIPF